MSKLSVGKTQIEDVLAELPKLPEGCVWGDDGSVVMTLRKPLSLAGNNEAGANTVNVNTLTFRDLTAGDMIDMTKMPTSGARSLFLLGASTGHVGPVGEKVLRAMSAKDYIRAQAVIDVFTNDGPETGTLT